ncbi:response regulator transcription factor [Alkalihalobacillus sp. TS-13]|uniref:response regulator transcription factor n=1 Tax=Alkalihalobacillus sp. TS-13 TaxID=2842455 RepID=UPI001C87D92D|nr:response regulator transcription factor [Alkalihalobacillus sp. TS-13]
MIRILIAEDQQMLLGALGSLLDMEEDMEVIGQAMNGKEALGLINKFNPDVFLTDIEMPFYSGLEVAEKLKKQSNSCRVIILTTFARPGYFERAVKADVHGYLLKDGSIEELSDSIRKVVQGHRVYTPELMINVMRKENPLTDREQEILKLAASGMKTKEITENLYLSHGTVRNYMSEIIHKLESKNRIEAVSIAEKKGWI